MRTHNSRLSCSRQSPEHKDPIKLENELANLLFAGNWKMNGTRESLNEVAELAAVGIRPGLKVLICPPATLTSRMAEALEETDIEVGGQNCHEKPSGAYTGEISAKMLSDAGATHVILGHSERRQHYGESDSSVMAKVRAAWRADLITIVCVGETEEQRNKEETLAVVEFQMDQSIPDGANSDNLVVAYEPVWAIGTGKTPALNQIAEVHEFIRNRCIARFGEVDGHCIRLLYGGSMNPSNSREILSLENVDGGLIGGASLKASDLLAIISSSQSK